MLIPMAIRKDNTNISFLLYENDIIYTLSVQIFVRIYFCELKKNSFREYLFSRIKAFQIFREDLFSRNRSDTVLNKSQINLN